MPVGWLLGRKCVFLDKIPQFLKIVNATRECAFGGSSEGKLTGYSVAARTVLYLIV